MNSASSNQKLPNKKRKYTKYKMSNKKSSSRDDKQDKEIAKLKKLVKVQAPPTKSSFAETGTLNPQNVWQAFGMPFPNKGGDINDRLGAEIELKSINLRYLVAASETDDFDTMRVILVQYMDGNEHDEYPVNHDTNLWLSTPTDYPYLAPYNTQSASTYRVLYDKIHHLCAAGEAEQGANVLLTPKDLAITHFKFDGDGGGALAGLDRGLIIGWICSNSSASPNPDFTATIRFNYTDS